MKFKRYLRHRSVLAPKVSIKRHLPWPLRLFFAAAILLICSVAIVLTYDLGRGLNEDKKSVQSLQNAQQGVAELSAQRDSLRERLAVLESRFSLEQAVQTQLATQLKALEAENNKLKEDLAFFENLLPTTTGAERIAIRRLTADMLGPTQLHYRFLILQGGNAQADFSGQFEVVVTLINSSSASLGLSGQSGQPFALHKQTTLVFPERKNNIDRNTTNRSSYDLLFRHYQRVDNVLTLPADSRVKSVQVRVLEQGQLRAQQIINLP